jgi:uroporphyrinogen-III synthase
LVYSKPKILITRSKDSVKEFDAEVLELSSGVIYLPTIETYSIPNDSGELAKLKAYSDYDYIIFTSANGVKYFFDEVMPGNSTKPNGVTIAAVGTKTAEAVSEKGWEVDFIPEEFTAEGLLEALSPLGVTGKRILIPGSAISRDTLVKGLQRLGAEVDFVPVYNTGTIIPEKVSKEITEVRESKPDIFIFTSPSSVKGFVELLPIDDEKSYFIGTIVVAIGNVTEKYLHSVGVSDVVIPDEFTIAGVINLLKNKILRKEDK